MLAARVLGELPSGFRTELYAKEHHTEYRFSVSGVMRVNAWVGSGRATIARDGTPLLSGRDLTKDLKAGDYTLTVQSPPGQVFKMSARRVAALPPTRLQASVWGGRAIRLNWDDNGDTEVQYRVDRWTKLGWRRGVRVGQDATAAVIDNLPLGSKTTYRVSAVTRTGASVASTNIVTAQTLNEDTTGWYKVKLSGNTRGEAGWTMQADTLKIATDYQGDNGWSKWVYASSWQTAVWTAIHSAPDPVKIKVTYNAAGRIKGDIVEHNFPSGGDFKVATVGELRAAQGSEGKNGFKLSPLANETKLIVLEDSYGGIDRDYDDFYWVLGIEYCKPQPIEVQISTFIKQPWVGDPQFPSYIYKGDNRMTTPPGPAPGGGAAVGPALFDKFNSRYRTRQSVDISPADLALSNGIVPGTIYNDVGITMKYEYASSIGADGQFTAAAIADSIIDQAEWPWNRNGMLFDADQTDTNSMFISAIRTSYYKIVYTFDMAADDPLVYGPQPDIDYDVDLEIDFTDPTAPTYTLSGTHDGFPCYEMYIGNTLAYSHDSGSQTLLSLIPPQEFDVSGSGNLP